MVARLRVRSLYAVAYAPVTACNGPRRPFNPDNEDRTVTTTRTAVRPFTTGAIVSAHPDWHAVAAGGGAELRVPFTTTDAALAYARTLSAEAWPLVDVIERHRGGGGLVIAARRTIPHPAMSPESLSRWHPIDTLAVDR